MLVRLAALGAFFTTLGGVVVQPLHDAAPAPAVVLEDLDGRPVTLRDFRGKVVFVNFWATWCIPCRDEMPALESVYHVYRDRGLVVVGINFKEAAADARTLVQRLGLSFPVVLDRTGAASQAFRVRGLPVSFMLDRDGRMVGKAIGSQDWDGPHGRAYLEELLR